MKFKLFIFAFLLLIPTFNVLAGFEDFSKKGGEYQILENLRINAKSIEYKEKSNFTILGKEFSASKFEVEASVFVQTVCCDRPDDAWGNVFARYEIFVGKDDSNIAHDLFLKKIYDFWSTTPTDGRYTSQYNLTLKDNDYLMFMAPSSHDINEQYHLVWIDGKYMKIIFKNFRDKDGAGATDSFWEKNIRFYVGKNKITPKFMVNEIPDEFLKLYKERKIRLKNSN
ncbi:MAG TPA: hypothetical protein PKY82_04185 [Pyrinomonadaceae bacterium]|nr:hypothetical protein [Pyrinomonadaceae bacterium]